MKPKSAALPTSKAKTAYGLLSDIATLALEEPQRLRMDIWLSRDAKDAGLSPVPSCNTVGCVGGWVVALKGPRRINGVYNMAVGEVAGAILGLTPDQESELFATIPYSCPQTAKHAREEARYIRKFQRKYRAQLLAKKV